MSIEALMDPWLDSSGQGKEKERSILSFVFITILPLQRVTPQSSGEGG
jgi:hypothetical protein